MSGPIVWDDNEATVDGIDVYESARYTSESGTFVSQVRHSDVNACTAIHTDRDLAARAVVAAVKVLRGEAVAAVAAERERCESLKIALREIARPKRGGIEASSTDAECSEYWSAACERERQTARDALSAIESGAPAPREG